MSKAIEKDKIDLKKFVYGFTAIQEKLIDGEKQKIEHQFLIARPDLRLKQTGDLYFAQQVSEFIRAKVLPRAAFQAILQNNGGSMSKEQEIYYAECRQTARKKFLDFQSKSRKTEAERSDAEKEELFALLQDIVALRQEIQTIENEQVAIFNNTAESKARDKTILWWTVQLSKKVEDKNIVDFFEGENTEEKLNKYDELAEDDEDNAFVISVAQRLSYLIALWYLGRAVKYEEFVEFDIVNTTPEAVPAPTDGPAV